MQIGIVKAFQQEYNEEHVDWFGFAHQYPLRAGKLTAACLQVD
jgi:hypothetical protein